MDNLVSALGAVFGAGLFYFTVLYGENWLLKKQGKQTYYLPEALSNVTSAAIYKVTDTIFIFLVLGAFANYIFAHGLRWSIRYDWWVYLVLYILLDFTFYFWHLACHKIRYAWIGHKIHHSSRFYNYSVSLRQSFFAPINMVGVIIWLPWVFLGFDVQTVLMLFELNLVYQFFLHTQTIDRLPNWIEWVFTTPAHHRVHHGCAPKQIDCNYGGTFIVWDRLFGTFVDQKDAGEIVFGVKSRPVNSSNLFVMLFEEVMDLAQTIRKTKDWRYLWKHPDWQPWAEDK